MTDHRDIREQMAVVGSDDVPVGTVERVEGDRLVIVPSEGGDGRPHYLPLTVVERVDTQVHLSIPAAGSVMQAGAINSGSGAAGLGIGEAASLPPVLNRQVPGAEPRRNFYLPWILAIVGLILLLLLFRSCVTTKAADTTALPPPAPASAPAAGAALPVEQVKLPNGKTVGLQSGTLNYELQRYLASGDAAPRTFTFDKLNFDTNSANIRAEDQPNVDALAQILSAYPKAAGRVVGYADARGSAGTNANLGQQRAEAVQAALAAQGIGKGRIAAASGGESNPKDTNATAQGQFENRRTELVITAK